MRRTVLLLAPMALAVLLSCGVALVGIVVGTGQAFAAPTYTHTDLGALPGGTGSEAYGINDSGQVVGSSTTGDGNSHAFLYESGQMKDLGTLPGHTRSIAYDINDSGQVVGSSTTATGGNIRAFLYDNGQMKDLGALPGGTQSAAYGINDSGQVVGYSDIGDGRGHAFLYENGQMKEIPRIGGSVPYAFAHDINNAGQVVGVSRTSGDYTHAFLYENGQTKDLGVLGAAGGNNYSDGQAINSLGQVVGGSTNSSGINRAYLYEKGTMKDLMSPLSSDYRGSAHGINDFGQVVGLGIQVDADSGNEYRYAFVYENGQMKNLNDLVHLDSSLTHARDVNASGQIVATTSDGGAVLLTPGTPPDAASPETRIISGPDGLTADNTPTFIFDGADDVSFTQDLLFSYRLDGQNWSEYSSQTNATIGGAMGVPDGFHTFYVRAKDEVGKADGTPAERSFTVDATPPVTMAPARNLVTGSAISNSTVPVNLSWSAIDATSGVARYQLQQSTNSGVFTDVALPSETTTAVTPSLESAKTYQFQVRAQDKAGNWSAWRLGPSFAVDLRQETHQAIAYTGTWALQSSPTASGGYVRHASASGTRAKFSFAGKQVAWVASTGSNRGKAEVWVDGTKAATVDLYAATAQPRKMLFTKSWGTSGNHTIEVRATGTKRAASTGTRVDVDAFVALR